MARDARLLTARELSAKAGVTPQVLDQGVLEWRPTWPASCLYRQGNRPSCRVAYYAFMEYVRLPKSGTF